MSTTPFVGRVEEQTLFKTLLKEIVNPPKGETLPYVVLAYGDGGIGKTELAKRLHQIADEHPAKLETWWIDWGDEAQKNPLLQTAREYISARAVFDVIHIHALHNKWGRQFVTYGKSIKQNSEAEHQLSQALVAIPEGGFNEMDAIRLASATAIAQIVRTRVPVIGHTGEELVQLFLEAGIRVGSEQARHLRAFLETQLRAKIKPDNYEHLLNLEQRLANALARGIRNASKKQPLVIVLDSYEIVDRADVWVREVIRLSGPRVLWLLVGRNDLLHSRQFGTTYFKGYDQDFPRRLVDFAMRRLSRQDIAEFYALRVPERAVDETALDVINRLTFGVPLAVAETAAVWQQGVSLEELNGETQNTASVTQVIRAMTSRLLRYASPKDKHVLYALALADGDVPVLEAMLRSDDLAEAFDLNERLLLLERSYAVVNASQARLHDVPQAFIREHLREPLQRRDDGVQQANEQAVVVLEARQRKLESELPTLWQRYQDQTWRDCVLTRVEHECWLGKDRGLPSFFRRLVEAQAYHVDFNNRLLDIVATWDEHWGEEDQSMLLQIQSAFRTHQIDGETLAILEKVAARGWLAGDNEKERRAIMDFWWGSYKQAQGDVAEARAHLEKARAALLHPQLRERAESMLMTLAKNSPAVQPAAAPVPEPVERVTEVDVAVEDTVEVAMDSAESTTPTPAPIPEPPSPVGAHATLAAAVPAARSGTMPGWLKLETETTTDGTSGIVADAAALAVQDSATLRTLAAETPNARHFVQLGDALLRERHFSDAIEAYNTALALKQGAYPPALISLGRLYHRLRLHEAAIECLQTATRIAPDNAEAHQTLGDLYLHQNAIDDAETHYKRSLNLMQSPAASRGLGDVHYARREWHAAKQQYDRAQALGGTVPLNHLAETQWSLGNQDSALAIMHQAIAADENPTRLFERLGDMRAEMGRYKDALAAYEQGPATGRVFRKTADVLYKTEAFERARALYEKALTSGDDGPDTQLGLGRSLYRLGDRPAAVAAYQRALSAGAAQEGIFRELATIQHNVGDLDSAERSYQSALIHNPHDPDALAGLSAVAYARGQIEQAAASAAYVLIIDEQPVARIVQGNIAHDQGHYRAALQAYESALARGIAPPPAKLAHVYSHTGRYRDAAALFETIEAEQRTPADWVALGEAYLALQETKKAVAAFQYAIGLDSQYTEAYLGLARARRQEGAHDDAVNAYARVLSLDNTQPVYDELGRILLDQRKYQLAHSIYGMGVRKFPDSGETWFGLGEAARNMGRMAQAAEAYDRALATRPYDVQTLAGRGAAALRRGEFAIAADMYEKVLQIDGSDELEAQLALGEAYQALHQPRKALRAYRRSAELDNTHVEAFLGIGATCEALDEVDYALAAYERAVKLDEACAPAFVGLGNIAGRRSDTSDALAHYRKALALMPEDEQAPVWQQVGQLLLTNKQPREAIRALNNALEHKRDATTLIGVGQAHMRLGEPHAALRVFQEADVVASDSEHAAAQMGIGEAYLVLNRLGDAAKAFEAVASANSGNEYAQFKLGETYRLMRRESEALARYEAALALNPNLADAYRGQGDVYRRREEHANAILAYEQALSTAGGLAAAKAGLAYVYHAINADHEAQALVDEAVAIDPRAEWLELQGDVALRLTKPEDAVAAYKNAIERQPDTSRLLVKLGRALTALERFSEAERVLKEAVRLEDSAESRTALGDLYAVSHSLPDAQIEYRLALEKNKDYVLAYVGMGDTHYHLGRASWAVEAYRTALALDAGSTRAITGLANIYRDQGDLATAIDMYKNAVDREPTAPIYSALGELYRQQNDEEMAIAAYESAINLDPQDLTSLGALAGLYRRRGDTEHFDRYVEQMRPLVYATDMPKYNRACFEAISGNTSESLRLLREAVAAGEADLAWIQSDPDLAFVRDDPRFTELLRDFAVPA